MIELERTIHCKSIIKIQHDYRHRAVETGLHPRQSSLASDSHSRRRATPPKRLRRLLVDSFSDLAGWKDDRNKVRRAGLEDVLGEHGDSSNVHGEKQQKLDLIANEILLRCLGNRPSVALVASEEDNDPRSFAGGTIGKYCVIFDPLDGSSNLDVCVGVGTIFAIRNDPNIPGAMETVCQPGHTQVAAGYILYGSSVVFVLTTGNGVDMFVLDPSGRSCS